MLSPDLVGRVDDVCHGRCGEQLSDDARHLSLCKSSNIGMAGIFGQGTLVSGRLGNGS